MNIGIFITQYVLRFVLEPTATGTTSEATAEASATGTATAKSATTATAATGTRTARATRTTEGTTAAKEVQTIDDVNHTVAGDGVILGITALGGIDDLADGGLLVQDVVELERDGEGVALEEAL